MAKSKPTGYTTKGDALRKIERERGKREKFLKTRMWLSTFVSTIFPDRVKIPENIGKNIFIGNNQLVTKNNLTSFIVIKEFSTKTPIAFSSKLTKYVKTKVDGVTVDVVIKNNFMNLNPNESGLESRRSQWYRTLENTKAPARIKKRAARLLYSYDVAKSGEKLFRSIVVIQIRAADGQKLKRGVEEAGVFLKGLEITYKPIKSKLDMLLQIIFLVSSRTVTFKKDLPYTIQSPITLAELLPATQGTNDDKGAFLGMNRYNRHPYFWDFTSSSGGKNIAIYSPTGSGKTYMGIAWLIDFYAMQHNLSVMDLKGNEFAQSIKALGGIIIPMRPDTKKFINTLYLDDKQTMDEPVVYYTNRFKLSLSLMVIVADVGESLESQCTTLLSNFLATWYTLNGITQSNMNTWQKSDKLHPLLIADAFRDYASNSIKDEYGALVSQVQSRFNEYFHRNGSMSYMFLEEFKMDEILASKSIMYDFGLLQSSGVKDPIGFRIKNLYMNVINNDFSRHKKQQKEWTIQYLEEAQLTEGLNLDLMSMYAQEFSIRRSQNRVNVLMCNSVTAIKDNPKARPIIDNTTILVIGKVNESSREYLIKEYSLESHRDVLVKIQTDPNYENTFLIVNRMKSDIPPALIKVYNPDEVTNGKLFKVVDTTR